MYKMEVDGNSQSSDTSLNQGDDNKSDTQQENLEMTVPHPSTQAVTGNTQMQQISPQVADYIIERIRTLEKEKKSLQRKLSQSEEQKKANVSQHEARIKEKDDEIKELKMVVTRSGVSDDDWNILNTLRDKTANPNEALSWFKPYHKNHPFSGRLLLFGTPSPESFRSLNALLPPVNIFNDIDTRKIRNLLVNTGFFNWEQDQL